MTLFNKHTRQSDVVACDPSNNAEDAPANIPSPLIHSTQAPLATDLTDHSGTSTTHPSVAVVIPCYNEFDGLRAAVTAYLHQSHPPDEIIIVDDGSTHSPDHCLPAHPTIRLIRQANAGAAAARYAGVLAARSDIVVFNDSGDTPTPDRIAVHLNSLARHPECGVSFAETVSSTRQLGSFARQHHIPLDGRLTVLHDPLSRMLGQAWPLAMAMNIATRRDVALQAARVKPFYRAANDYVLQLRAAGLSRFVHAASVTMQYAESSRGLSKTHGPTRQAAFALHAAARFASDQPLTPEQLQTVRKRINAQLLPLLAGLIKSGSFRLAHHVVLAGLPHLRPGLMTRSLWWSLRKH